MQWSADDVNYSICYYNI